MISLSNIKEIKIDNININGNIGIYETDVFSIKSVNIIGDITLSKIKDEFLINNSHFKQNNEITHNGYIITIKESSEGTISDTIFDTDVSTKQVISIHDCNNLIIKDSKFNGSLDKIDKMENAHNFHRVFLIYNSNNIELNNLHIQNFGGNTFEGYIMCISSSKNVKIKNCKIHNGFSINSEMIKVSKLSEINMENTEIYDIYSHMESSIIYNEGELNITELEFYNSYYGYEKVRFDKQMHKSDILILGSEQSKTEVYKSRIHDININSIFLIKNKAKMKINNTDIENINIYNIGAPFATSNSINGNYQIDSVTLGNIHQKEKFGSGALLIYLESSANINITNSKIENSISNGYTSSLIHMDTTYNNYVSLKYVNFSNVETHEYMINVPNGKLIEFYKVNFLNCSSESGMVYISNTDTVGSYLYLNVNGFNKDKSNNAFLINSGSKEYTGLLYSEIKNSKLGTLFNYERAIQAFVLDHSTLENNEFIKSALFSESITCPAYVILNSRFISNIGEKGTILHADCKGHGLTTIENNIFKNNVAKKYGGVFYYNNLDTSDKIKNCIFYNNTAPIGTICFAKSRLYEPKFVDENEIPYNITDDKRNFINDGSNYGGPFVTNPTYIKCDPLPENKYFFSGDYIKNITCRLFDDYNNIYKLSENIIDQFILDDFVYFKIEPNIDSSTNIILRGKTFSYCIGNKCSIENIRVFGNSGNYNISFKIIAFGKLLSFDNSMQTINITINDCPNNGSYFTPLEDQNLKIKSCTLSKCIPECIHGNCKDSECKCEKGWIGNNCNENPKFEKNSWLPWIFYIFGSIEFTFITILIVLTIYFREMKEIKIGKPFYLISILLGIILQIMIIFLAYIEPSPIFCILKIWFKYMGNSFIFGSIVVKCYQMANIYNVKKTFKTITNNTILKYYIIIIIINVILLLMWTLFDDVQTIKTGYTIKREEFKICSSPETSFFGIIFSILFIYICLSNIYETRHIPSNLKEPLGLTIYAYSLYVLIDIFITFYIDFISSDDNDNINNISLSPEIINSVQCLSILVFSPIVAYKLNFKKIYNIIYNEYILNKNIEGNNESQYVSFDQSKRHLERTNRDNNQKFEISSINFF